MQHFNAADFIALSPAKAKAQALAMFGAAQIDSMPDWQAVAYVLHSVVTRKRGKAASQDETAMQDSADAGEFTPWADYQPTGKGTAIARGRVTVTFADGWTATVGLLAGKTGKGRKPWSIGHAVRYAVLCYKLAAARRATGGDAIMYHQRSGLEAGLSVALDALIEAPEMVSIISADSSETVAGDLIWSPCEANAMTRDLRAGAVAVPLMLAPMPAGISAALAAARADLVGRMGLVRSAMHMLAKEAAARVVALLYAGGSMAPEFEASEELFRIVWDNPADYPESAAAAPVEADAPADEEEISADVADDEPGLFGEEELAVSHDEPAPADHFTALAATEIVGGQVDADALADWSAGLSAISYRERFLLVEDALLAWPALVEPCTFADGEPVQIGEEEAAMGIPMTGEEGEGQHEDTTLPPTAGEAEAKGQPGIVPPAAVEDVAEPAPRVKPRYRVRADGSYELVK